MQRKVGQDMVIKRKSSTQGDFVVPQTQQSMSRVRVSEISQRTSTQQRPVYQSNVRYQKKQPPDAGLIRDRQKKNKSSIITRLFRKIFSRQQTGPLVEKSSLPVQRPPARSSLDDTTFPSRPTHSSLPPVRGGMLWIFSIIAFIALLLSIFSLITRATIDLTLKESQYSLDTDTVFYQEPSADQIGFKTATTTDTESIIVRSTTRDSHGSVAHGTVKLFSTGPRTTVPAKTQLTSTTTGKKFITTTAVTIPAGSVKNPTTAEVAVAAVESGEQSNIGRDDFTLEKFTTISARSLDDITGGSSQNKFVLTNDQLQTTKQQLTDRMKLRDSSVFLSKQIPADFLLLNSLTQVADIVFTQQSVENGVSVTASRVITGNMVRRDDLNRYLKTVAIPESDQSFMSITDISKIQITAQVTSSQSTADVLPVQVTGTVVARAQLDQSTLLPVVADHKKKDAKQTLINTPGVASATVTVWPPWFSRIPNRVSRIHIITTFQETL